MPKTSHDSRDNPGAGGSGANASARSMKANSSATYKVARAVVAPSRPNPIMELIELKEDNTGTLFIHIDSKARPPTHLKKGQGRHISAYVLMLEAVLARIELQSPEDIAKLIDDMLMEYIYEDTEAVEAYRTTVKDIIGLKEPEIFTKEKRDQLDKALQAALTFFKADAVKEVFEPLTKRPRIEISSTEGHALSAYEKYKENVLAITEEDILLVKNLLKQSGQLAHYSSIISVVMSNALKLLSKMDEVAFKAKKTKAPKNESSLIIKALKILREMPRKGHFSDRELRKMGKAMADFFDYPAAECEELIEKNKKAAAHRCIKLIRRHIKFTYDAYPKISAAFINLKSRKKLCDPLMTKVRVYFGWEKAMASTTIFKDNISTFNSVNRQLKISAKSCLIAPSEKFKAKIPDYKDIRHIHEEKLAGAVAGGSAMPISASSGLISGKKRNRGALLLEPKNVIN